MSARKLTRSTGRRINVGEFTESIELPTDPNARNPFLSQYLKPAAADSPHQPSPDPLTDGKAQPAGAAPATPSE